MQTRIFRIKLDQLDDFIRNTAQPGDVALATDPRTVWEYMCVCKKDHISGKAKPYWTRVDTRALWKAYFANMTLEQKVDFLIDEYIDKHS